MVIRLIGFHAYRLGESSGSNRARREAVHSTTLHYVYGDWLGRPASFEAIKQSRNLCGSVSIGGSLAVTLFVPGFSQIAPTNNSESSS
jgi:hypothetical protein